MTPPTPVTVMTSFTLSPQSQDTWLLAWGEVARLASRQPECREFRLLRNRQSTAQFAILTTWENADALSRFIRRSGFVWLDDALNDSRSHSDYLCFEHIGVDAADAVRVETRELVGVATR